MQPPRFVFGVVASVLVACAPPPAPTTPAAPSPTAQAPRCAPNEPTQPADVRDAMKKGGTSVKGCFVLGKSTSTPPSLRVSLRVGPNGEVKSLTSQAPGSEPSQLSCAEGVLRKLTFARFCGDDVEVNWTYALGS
jgi:hypothetical protein